jgi:chromosome segregation ATPase
MDKIIGELQSVLANCRIEYDKYRELNAGIERESARLSAKKEELKQLEADLTKREKNVLETEELKVYGASLMVLSREIDQQKKEFAIQQEGAAKNHAMRIKELESKALDVKNLLTKHEKEVAKFNAEKQNWKAKLISEIGNA